jgi:prepilin-type N-terminal cleavage/methylation domain-containing protein
MKKTGFTLIELMLVVLIFTFLFGVTLGVMSTSSRSWREGQNKLSEQQEARKAVDSVARLLRRSNPDWVINGTHYPVTIISNNRIDFYEPVFDEAGEITTLKKITFKLNPVDTSQLLKKQGAHNALVMANNIRSVYFGGGCSGCSAFNCSSVADDCPIVKIDVQAGQGAGFALSSEVTLRNTNIALQEDVEVEQPAEGEF